MRFRIDSEQDSYSKAPSLIKTATVIAKTACQLINHHAKNQTRELQKRLHQN